MKRAYLQGGKLRAFCSVSSARREALARIASRPSSRREKDGRTVRTGTIFAIDNGSENMLWAEKRLASQGITQYRTRPKSPRDKPFAERPIGALRGKCLTAATSQRASGVG